MKTIYCDYCGEDLGLGEKFQGELESCGKPECNRYVSECYAAQEDEARYQAEQDGYAAYGGPGRY